MLNHLHHGQIRHIEFNLGFYKKPIPSFITSILTLSDHHFSRSFNEQRQAFPHMNLMRPIITPGFHPNRHVSISTEPIQHGWFVVSCPVRLSYHSEIRT
ncbi:hypothetical protein I308_100157 [Cryptococcus tetragattii IND107]|uniref:Uncharacterized protein n=1 Tax=Cryptococcus tetragattii IND107 TaxID=1296105 RepID=A0ABR3C401_9TREE